MPLAVLYCMGLLGESFLDGEAFWGWGCRVVLWRRLCWYCEVQGGVIDVGCDLVRFVGEWYSAGRATSQERRGGRLFGRLLCVVVLPFEVCVIFGTPGFLRGSM